MGSCVSSFSKKQTKLDAGISSETAYSQTTNKKAGNRFHENDNVVNSSSTNANNARKAKVVKKQKKKIHKGLISLPSNFQHTGHIGITELRSGKVDPEKIKNQMAEVAAALSLEDLNLGSSVSSTTPINNDVNPISSEQQQIVTENNDNDNSRPGSPQNDYQFKVKRKPTLTPISSPVQQKQNPRPSSPSSLNPTVDPTVDPMAEIVAALKMPIDGNFDKQNDQLVV